MRAEVLPTKVDTVEAFISPEVFSSRILAKKHQLMYQKWLLLHFLIQLSDRSKSINEIRGVAY